ncbi:MarR family transcriptional regulator [Kribbella sp. NPDC056861]|uniref:MarR family winged helix-turn-helix transcriptional regulator n=1 Tax=Kribbella sp. NPDC056861 TaxID=3154857 RepID=UPI0034264562
MTELYELMPQLTQLSNALNRGHLVERAIKATGLQLDRPAMSILLALQMADRPLRIGEIAERMQVVGPHVTRQVQELERRGLVQRIGDPNDRRASLIEPTPVGADAAQLYLKTLLGWLSGATADWPAQDRKDLSRLLARFTTDLSAHLATLED